MSTPNYYELSNPQRRIWLTELLNDHKDMSNIGYLIQLKGKYNLEKLAQAIKHVFKINDGLQLRFRYADKEKGELEQYLPPYEEIDVEIIEVASEAELFERIEAKHRQRFDISGSTFCSFAVFSINNEKFGLFEKAHHLVADGISATIVGKEALLTYQRLEGSDIPEVQKDVSYMDFLEYETQYTGSEKYNKSKNYWMQRFDDFSGEEITFERGVNIKNSLKAKRLSFDVPEHIIQLLEKYIAENRMSNFGMFMATLAIYFNRFMNHEDIVIGMPVHNRNTKAFKSMVGMFVSTLPFRVKFEEDWSFNDIVAYVKTELWNSLKHQAYPYNHMVKDLKDMGIDSDGFLNVQLIELPPNQDEIEKRVFYNTQYNISELSIYLNQQKGKSLEGLDIAIDFHEDIFPDRDIQLLFKRLMVILEQCIAEPSKPLKQLTLLEESEYKELIVDLKGTVADFPTDQTLPQLFSEQVQQKPGAIALEYEGKTVTYKELGDLTDTLAARLQTCGVGPDAIVGILCERSIEAMVAILSIQKAGGAYLPIDPDYPSDRINYIVENSGIKLLLIEKVLESRRDEVLETNSDIQTLIIDVATLEQEPAAVDFNPPALTSENLAYVIYTSGTTGKPKGTLLRHRNAINYLWWGAKVYTKGQETTFPLFTSLSFDLTVTSIFIPMITGNKLVIYRDSQDGLLVERVVKENKVDIIKLTPSHLKVVNQLKFETSRIKSFIVGGEELTSETAKETVNRFGPDTNIYNEYGPTETAVGCMIHRYDKDSDTDRTVPIGKPADNVSIYILDKHRNPLPPGVTGEIYIAGEGVALGYHNNETLTADKFVDNPFVPGQKMYRSGDLGRWNLERILEFFGRCDEQVKVRGYRIELGEIEKQLKNIDGISDAVVTLRKESDDLCAYFVAEGDREFEVTGMRELLSRELPVYMLPAEFVAVTEIPLTRNGKVDHRKLETMGKTLESSHEYVAPRDDNETLLADIWAGVLNVERVGITDNFFELGGDSIKAVQIAARMNDAHKTINVKDILSHQTVANVCANVDFDSHIRFYEQGTIEGEKEPTPIESWFLAQGFSNPNHYNQSVLLKFKTDVDVPALEKSLNAVMAHHDGMRLNYNKEKGIFYFNNNLLTQAFKLQTIDVSKVPEIEREEYLSAKGYEIKGSFNIENGPMMRAVLFTGDAEGHKLLLTLHHLVVDGLSWRILLEQLYHFYDACLNGKAIESPQKTASLHDWHDALILYRDAGKLENEKSYWQEVGALDFRLPYDHDPAAVDWSLKNKKTVAVYLDPADTEFMLKNAHDVYKTDVQILVTAALVRTLRQWTGKQAVSVEIENHGRHIEDLDTSKTFGWFTTIYPLLVNREDREIGDEIKTVKEAIRKVPENGIGYGIMKYMTPEGKAMETERTEVRFNYLGQFDQEIENPLFSYIPDCTGSDVAMENHMSTGLEVNTIILNNRYSAAIDYNALAFDDATIEGFGDDYIRNLKEILAHIKGEDNVHFTPSDFDTVDLSEDDLAALFE